MTMMDKYAGMMLRIGIMVLFFALALPDRLAAQTDGGDPPKTEKPEKPPKEKKEKPPKEKKEKPPKAPKEKKEKKGKTTEPSDESPTPTESGEDDPQPGADPADPKSTKEEPPKDLIGGKDDTSRVTVSCYRYHTGYMEFIDKNYHGIKIKRTGKKEIHTNTNDGNKLTFKIEWESDFVYKLTFVKAKLPSRFKKGYTMKCEMKECWDEYYDCDCNLNGIVQYATVLKVKSPKEIKDDQKKEIQLLKEQEAAAKRDSIEKAKKANGTAPDPKGSDAKVDPKADPKSAPATTKGKPETPKASEKPKKAKQKKEKPVKEKKEKAPKEKKEKAPKEKAEKPPKEKKEKPPKEE